MSMLSNQQSRLRRRKREERAAERRRIAHKNKIILDNKWAMVDHNRDGILDENEVLVMMLCVLAQHESENNYTRTEVTTPDEKDAKFLVSTCDKNDSGGIERDEFENAINIYTMYLESAEEIAQIFDEFDKNESGRLEQEQLRAFINENVLAEDDEPLQDSELQAVMDYCKEIGSGEPGVGKFELKFAEEEVYRLRKAKDDGCSIQ